LKHLLVMTSVFISLVGCGGGGSDTAPTNNSTVPINTNTLAPSIANLAFSTSKIEFNDGGGSKSVYGNFNFNDPDGDIVSLRITTSIGDDEISPLSSMEGRTSGSVYAYANLNTTQLGEVSYTISVIDSSGNESNKLYGTYNVVYDWEDYYTVLSQDGNMNFNFTSMTLTRDSFLRIFDDGIAGDEDRCDLSDQEPCNCVEEGTISTTDNKNFTITITSTDCSTSSVGDTMNVTFYSPSFEVTIECSDCAWHRIWAF